MSMKQERQLLPTGEFARRSGLSLKALRIYDENGLLRPAEVDPATGRRGYGPEQLQTARLIGMLRGAGMSLAEISLLLADLTSPQGVKATERLDHYLDGLERRHTGRRFLIGHVRAILREEGPPMFPIETRHVPAQRVMSMQRRLRAPETDGFVAEAQAAFRQHLDGAAQWDFPAILAAYDAVAGSPEVSAAPRSSLSCREVYVADPAVIGPDENVCDIAFPLG